MIRDLVGAGEVRLQADVLIVGGGTVGLLMATRLCELGLRVVCLESGGEHQEADTHPLNAVEQVGTTYAGAAHGRFRCLGGTSTRWGGALIPFVPADLTAAAWPVGMSQLEPFRTKVEALFGLPQGPYELPDVLGRSAEFEARLAKWPPFRQRNVLTLLGKEVRADAGPDVWVNATACQFNMAEGRLTSTLAKATDGSNITVAAHEVVFACGAIESTRLLLLVDAQNQSCIDRASTGLGLGFFDHLSAVTANLRVHDRNALNRLVGFRFGTGGTMRNMRFEMAPGSKLRSRLPACFAHIAFDAGDSGGFHELRSLFRRLQRGRLPGIGDITQLAAHAPWLVKAAYWRFVEKRLLYPADAAIQVHMVIDQAAVDSNRISLSTHSKDYYGQPLARIDWRVSDQDRQQMAAAADAFLISWANSPRQRIAQAERVPDETLWHAMETGGGIYHPGGSTRMASKPNQGVVDDQLRVFGAQNLRVVATSVMPSGGAANPTMTLLMLGLRCVESIGASLKAGK